MLLIFKWMMIMILLGTLKGFIFKLGKELERDFFLVRGGGIEHLGKRGRLLMTRTRTLTLNKDKKGECGRAWRQRGCWWQEEWQRQGDWQRQGKDEDKDEGEDDEQHSQSKHWRVGSRGEERGVEPICLGSLSCELQDRRWNQDKIHTGCLYVF